MRWRIVWRLVISPPWDLHLPTSCVISQLSRNPSSYEPSKECLLFVRNIKRLKFPIDELQNYYNKFHLIAVILPILTAFMHNRTLGLSVEVAAQLIALLIIAVVVYTIAVSAYNIFFHPLRKFPGPLLARATNLVSHFQSSRGRSVAWMHELHKMYGPVVRFAPNKLSSIQPETWKEVYGHGVPQWSKDPKFYGRDPCGADTPGLIRAGDNSHARQRKLVSHAFSDRALREQEHLVKHYVSLLVEKLEQDAAGHDGKVDLVAWLNYTTFDVMADLTFGESLNQLAGSMYSPWVRSIFNHIRSIQLLGIAAEWQPFTRLLTLCLVPSHIIQERQNVYRYSADKVEDRLRKQVQRNDIWSYILRYSNDENQEKRSKGLVHSEMLSNGQTFMTAGTETTATLLSGLFFYLLRDPRRHTRLVNEIRTAFSTYEGMTMASLAEQKYLQACIDEALRIYPPVAVGLPRVAPIEGAKLGADFVPKGTRVQLTQFAAYHSSLNFKDPDDFVPERWLPEGQAVYGADKREIVQPFSYGPRNCIGKNLAYHEMRFIAASLLWHFDLELTPGVGDWANQPVYIIWDKKPLVVFLKARC